MAEEFLHQVKLNVDSDGTVAITLIPAATSISASTFRPKQPADRSKPVVGLLYDSRCAQHSANYAHVEQPARVTATFASLTASTLLNHPNIILQACRPANDDELLLTHSAAHVASIDAFKTAKYKTTAEVDSDSDDKETAYSDCAWIDGDTYANAHTPLAARLSVGGGIDVVHSILRHALSHAFALTRPPGHHADVTRASGFCIYNTVACVVRAVQAESSLCVAIVDWDVHHGNGTQNIFYNDNNVLYISIHRYDHGKFYPGTGATNECGGDKTARGFNVNIPLSSGGMGDDEYMFACRRVIVPIITQYNPDLIFVSSGFDCMMADPLGGMHVTSECIYNMTRMLCAIGKPLVVMLEGGYNLNSIKHGVHACLYALLGEPLPDAHYMNASPLTNSTTNGHIAAINGTSMKREWDQFVRDISAVISIQSAYWHLTPLTAEETIHQRTAKQPTRHSGRLSNSPATKKTSASNTATSTATTATTNTKDTPNNTPETGDYSSSNAIVNKL